MKKAKSNNAYKRIAALIDEQLNKIFGKEATLLIYKYLQKKYGCTMDEIYQNMQLFTEGLQSSLGSGAIVVEKAVLSRIATDFELEVQPKSLDAAVKLIQAPKRKRRRV